MTLPYLFLTAAQALLGPRGYIDDAAVLAPHLVEWRGLFKGRTPFMACPGSVEEAAAFVRLCAEHRVGLVPQGGNTGLVGGATPDALGRQVLVHMGRLNRIRQLDILNDSLVAEAGCFLAEVQQAALEADRLFPLSLASEGSCTIGGNISSNAGGVHVVRYGPMRDLVLGLEAIMPNGEIWHGLKALRKDNSGYDLKQLLIGAEGTLGLITAASLKLFPLPRDRQVIFCAIPDVAAALNLLALAKAETGAVVACELMPRIGLDLVCRHIPDCRDPFTTPHPWYLLLEFTSTVYPGDLAAQMDRFLADAVNRQLVSDAVVAQSSQQIRTLWRLRESLSEAQKKEGGSIKHDISVPTSRIPEFLTKAEAAVHKRLPLARIVAFGHVGDGNIHYNLSQPLDMDRQHFLDLWHEMSVIVHDVVLSLNGSISAEHGIGRLKRDELRRTKQPLELELQRRIKHAIDPLNIMNPGVLVVD